MYNLEDNDDSIPPVNSNGEAMTFEQFQEWNRRGAKSSGSGSSSLEEEGKTEENMEEVTSAMGTKAVEDENTADLATETLNNVETLARETLLAFPKMKKEIQERLSAIVVLCGRVAKS